MLGLFKTYIEKRIELLKLEITENTMKIISVAAYALFLLILSFIFVSFLLIAIGFVLGNLLGSYTYGFLIISVFLFLCLLIFFYQKKFFLETLKDKFVRIINEE